MIKILSFLLFGLLLLTSCATGVKAPSRKSEAYRMAWSKNLSPYYMSGNLSYNRKSALIHDKKVFTSSDKKKFSAYDVTNGRVIWSIDEDSEIVSYPVIAGKNVIYSLISSKLIARDFQTGQFSYEVNLNAAVNSEPVVAAQRIFLPLEGNQIVALDYRTGELLWTYQRASAQTTTLQRGSSPIVYKKTLIMGFDDGYYVSLSLKDGSLQWSKRIEKKGRFLDLDLKALYAYRKLYLGGGQSGTHIVDPVSGLLGKKLKTVITANPIKVEGGILLGQDDGYIVMVSATGKFKRRVRLGNSAISSLENWGVDQVIAINLDGDFYSLNATSLEPTGHFSLGHPESTVTNGVAIEGDWAAIYTSRYRLYVLNKN